MAILTPEQLQRWEDDGYLLIPGFYTPEETKEMYDEATRLSEEFDATNHPMTAFETDPDKHVGDKYFLESNDKIRYFLEPDAVEPATADRPARLRVPASRSVNKIGHALAQLNPVFRKYTFESGKVEQLAREMGKHEDPRVLQSMLIFKQPGIGGPVPCHNDSTFLYTSPQTTIGAWIALEECTPENGCLSARIASRFVRNEEGYGVHFQDVKGVKPNEDWDEKEGWQQAPCPPGTLVLIHGSVMHKSPPNPSEKTRTIYTFHMIDGKKGVEYDEHNWLQPTKAMPFQPLFGSAQTA